jgi:hypothetical protein
MTTLTQSQQYLIDTAASGLSTGDQPAFRADVEARLEDLEAPANSDVEAAIGEALRLFPSILGRE